MAENNHSYGHRPTVASIDLDRLKGNFRALKTASGEPGAFFCPMVKADAYGHGDVAVAMALRSAGAEHLGVSLIEEGLNLRQSGDKGSILSFGMFSHASEAEAVLAGGLTPVVSDWAELALLDKALMRGGGRTRATVHLKFNTGMNRLGFDVENALRLREWFDGRLNVQLAGVCTHFLRSEDLHLADGDSQRQLQLFEKALAPFKGMKLHLHALNSGAIAASRHWAGRQAFQQRVGAPLGARPGIALYGSQVSTQPDLQLAVQPVLSLSSRLAMTRKVKVGESVSYNATWRARRDSLIGVVPVGYGDGWMRLLSNRGSVLCRGQRAPVVGNVCMDYFMVDLTDVASATSTPSAGDVQPGEEIVLIGEQSGARITAEEVAGLCGTISYEIFTAFGRRRVPKQYHENEKRQTGTEGSGK